MAKRSFNVNSSGGGKNRKRNFRSAGFVALLILFGLIIFSALNQPSSLKETAFSDVIRRANSGEIKKIEVTGEELAIIKKGEDKPSEKSRKEAGSSIYEQGLNKDAPVQVDVKPQNNSGAIWTNIGLSLLPILVISIILFYMLKSAQGQGNQALSFGKSRARLYGNEKEKVTFANIAGSDEAKQDLEEIVEFLKFPKKI